VATAPPKGVRHMVQATRVTGICSTCRNMATCCYFATRGPVFFCELFEVEGHTPPNPAPPVRRAPRRRPAPARVGNPVREIPRLKGLCVNCELRSTCTYPRPPEGVWYCEEYM
jgi:hypothetical protein